MSKSNKPLLHLLALSWFTLLALACTLTSSSAPPTLVPRATETPLPTIAYATLSPEELPQQQFVEPALDVSMTSLLNQVQSDRLFVHIDTLQNYQTRHVNSVTNASDRGIGAAYNYIKGQFEDIQQEAGGNFQLQEHSFPLKWGGLETVQTNVYGVIPGKEIGGGVIVVGAHYDSVSLDFEDGAAYAPGANDNASGVAALIEIARILSKRPHRATIMLVAFSAEEVGRIGSREFVKFLQSYQIDIKAMINMDIIGSQTGQNGEVNDRQIRLFSEGPNESPSRQIARAIHLLDATYMPNMDIIIENAGDRIGRYSDHLSFSEAGWAAVRFIEPLEDIRRQHTPEDTIDDVQATYLTRSTQTVLAVVTALADGPPAPRNVSLRSNPQGTRTLVWEPSAGAASYLIALRRPGALTYGEKFPWTGTSVDWDGFRSDLFASYVIFAVDQNGLMGPPSTEYTIP